MSDIGVTVEGVDGFEAGLDALRQRMHSATRSATSDGLKLLKRRAHGKLSVYYHPPGTPTPSSPGQPPARITGRLRDSLTSTGPTATGSGFTGQLGPTRVYSRIQELGGQAGRGHSITIPPRPFLAPTVRDAREDLRCQYIEAWRRAL